jgi:hypothetical protein
VQDLLLFAKDLFIAAKSRSAGQIVENIFKFPQIFGSHQTVGESPSAGR